MCGLKTLVFTGKETIKNIKPIKLTTSPDKQKKVPKNCYKNVRIFRQIQFVDYEMIRTNWKELN